MLSYFSHHVSAWNEFGSGHLLSTIVKFSVVVQCPYYSVLTEIMMERRIICEGVKPYLP